MAAVRSTTCSAAGTPQKRHVADREVKWRENTEEREKHRTTTSVDLMTYYLENCHKPKPVHMAGFKKPKDKKSAMVPVPKHRDIFPKYPLPVNFITMQQQHILQHPPIRRPYSAAPSTPSPTHQPAILISVADLLPGMGAAAATDLDAAPLPLIDDDAQISAAQLAPPTEHDLFVPVDEHIEEAPPAAVPLEVVLSSEGEGEPAAVPPPPEEPVEDQIEGEEPADTPAAAPHPPQPETGIVEDEIEEEVA
eukprot:EG_transcript_18497